MDAEVLAKEQVGRATGVFSLEYLSLEVRQIVLAAMPSLLSSLTGSATPFLGAPFPGSNPGHLFR
jgi:hypothetical protein